MLRIKPKGTLPELIVAATCLHIQQKLMNLLPHKSWNVWNRDNREKVEKDQRELKEKEDKKRKRLLEIVCNSVGNNFVLCG